MRIAICDDSRIETEQLLAALHDYDPTRHPDCYASGAALISAFEADTATYDLVFLDIYMPGENGIHIAEQMRKLAPDTDIVFVTTSEDHAVDAFSLGAVHYLVKPITSESVIEALRRVVAKKNVIRPAIVVQTGNAGTTLYIDEISYIQSIAHAKEIMLTNGRTVKVWQSFEELLPKLGNDFLRLNRTVLVNMAQIEYMGNDSCLLKSGTRFDFSRKESGKIRSEYDRYLFFRLQVQAERRSK